MDIGSKIKNARIESGMTQEAVAEALGVSRQTVSNWECSKTYPDIVSVVKMSDLYGVSLDYLLKGEVKSEGQDYLSYLEDSTNTVRSNIRKSENALIIAFLAIWAVAVMVFWLIAEPDDAMAYSLLFIWLLIPIEIFVSSLLIGKNGFFGSFKWVSPVIFGVMYMLSEYATFSLSNMVAFDKFNLPRFGMIFAGALISLVGLVLGLFIKLVGEKENTKK